MEPSYDLFSLRWNAERPLIASESSASLHSSCPSDMSTDTSFTSSDDDGAPIFAPRTRTIYDFDAHVALGQRHVVDGRLVDEGDEGGDSSSDSASADDSVHVAPRRTVTIYDFEAYIAPRQTRAGDGSGDEEDDESISEDAGTESDSSNDDEVSVRPGRTETIYDLDAYLARRQPSVANGSGEGEYVERIVDVARTRHDSSSDALLVPLRAEAIDDLGANLARAQAPVTGISCIDEGDDGIPDGALPQHHSSSYCGVAPSFTCQAAKTRDLDAALAERRTRVADSIGDGDDHVDLFPACRRQLPTSSSSNDQVAAAAAAASSSHLPSRSLSADAADTVEFHDNHLLPRTEDSSRQCFRLGEDGSSSLAAAREFTFGVAQEVHENIIGEATVLPPSDHAACSDELLSPRAVHVPSTPERSSIIAMVRARRGADVALPNV
eukprot:TRINITY_DN6247_c0_g1_i1.p1 TRINITY_DN6247_c0_g1~~TRINITY_DN6247_c0_g1_i1.p1  ORF type:complete len:438 (-),score=62.31 TRINITY_DN6247_c0_g1_i1:296-1609(-)